MNVKASDPKAGKLQIFASYIYPHRKLFAIDMTLSVMIALTDLVFPYVSRWSMHHLLPEKMFQAFFAVMAAIFTAYMLKAFFQYKVTVIGHGMGTLVEADMRQDIFTHMQELSFSFFDTHRTGVLMTRIANDLFEIVELAHHGPENILTCVITIAGALIVLFTNIINEWYAKDISDKIKAAMRVKALNGDCMTGMAPYGYSKDPNDKTRLIPNERAEIDKFNTANEQFRYSKVKYYAAMGRFNAGVEATVGVMQVAVVTLGGFLIMRGEMNYIDLVTFTLYVSTFTAPVRKLVQFMEIFTSGMAGFDRFLELPAVLGDIRFDHVSFSYNDGTEVLEDINIHIRPGETFALVGASGGGKSTMCHLIPRFYDVKEGAVLIDGQDVRKVTQESLRRHIGIIQQDVFLFAGTVMDNIRYGKPDATDEEIVRAAIRAEIHDDIMQMPEGYRTYVGERGIQLSGGQKQRISIARVFLKNPRVLILDEATSALDSVTEQKIQESLERLSVGKTCIVIAHRLSTVRNADRIAVVEGKHIPEQGTRQELLERNGIYAALERAQELSDVSENHE